MRKTKRVKKGKRKTRRIRGGERRIPAYRPPGGMPNWPPEDGCAEKSFTSIVIKPGSYFDRFGEEKGTFVAIMGKNTDGTPLPSSYDARSMRALGETPFIVTINGEKQDVRKYLYEMIYNSENDKDNELYYVLKVIKQITGKFPCRAAPAFNYNGGAYQLELPKSIGELIADGTLKRLTTEQMEGREIDTDRIPFPKFPKFPKYTDPFVTPGNFKPYDTDRNLGQLIQYYKDKDTTNASRVPGTPTSAVWESPVVKQTTVVAPLRPRDSLVSPIPFRLNTVGRSPARGRSFAPVPTSRLRIETSPLRAPLAAHFSSTPAPVPHSRLRIETSPLRAPLAAAHHPQTSPIRLRTSGPTPSAFVPGP